MGFGSVGFYMAACSMLGDVPEPVATPTQPILQMVGLFACCTCITPSTHRVWVIILFFKGGIARLHTNSHLQLRCAHCWMEGCSCIRT